MGEWLRKDLENGWISQTQDDPDLTIILSQARKYGIALIGKTSADLFEPIPNSDLKKAIKDCLPGVVDSLSGDERNVLLTLARMWATLKAGDFLTKDKGAQWVISKLPKKS